jgi:hypothetical protein
MSFNKIKNFFEDKKNIIIIVILITIIVFSIIGYIYYNKTTHDSTILQKNVNRTIEKELGLKNILINPKISNVNNKLDIKTNTEKEQYLLEKKKFKHKTFLNNINNSLNYCIENNKFDTAEYIHKYKNIYVKLYKLKENDKTNKKIYSDKLNIINNIIRQNLNMYKNE